MGTTKGTVTLHYRIKVDLLELARIIAREFSGELVDNDIEVEDFELIIPMSHKTKYEAWYCRATLESPEENEVDLEEPIFVDDANFDVVNALHKITNDDVIAKIDLDDESDWDFPEPYDPYWDDNDAYDRYRDAYYDREYAERGE